MFKRNGYSKTESEKMDKDNNTTGKNTKLKRIAKVTGKIFLRFFLTLFVVVISILIFLISVCSALFNGPSVSARNIAIKSLDETSGMKWVSGLFLPDEVIQSVLHPEGMGATNEENEKTEAPFTYDFSVNEKTYDVTIDLGISLRLVLRENMKVKSAEISDELQGFSLEEAEKKSFEEIAGEFLESLNKSGKIVEGGNDALLIGTIADSDSVSTLIGEKISAVISAKELPVTVLSLYSVEEDTGVSSVSKNLHMSYNKVKLCNLVSGKDSSLFYFLSMMNLTEILGYCEENSIDIKTLVNSANIKETEKIPVVPETQEDEWKDYPDGIMIKYVAGQTYNATVMIIKDPSRVYAVGANEEFVLGVAGKRIDTMIAKEGAVAAINGGFFVDGSSSNYQGQAVHNGGIPYGTVISGGKYVFENNTGNFKSFVGITEDNVLVAFNGFITEETAKKYKIRDGLNCYPVLIVNGEAQSYSKGGISTGLNPRTAIGQRADGAIIFLTIDGRLANSIGGSLDDIIDIMLEFGAVTAVNLDGGTSSSMVYLDSKGEYGQAGKYVFLNKRAVTSGRTIPTYFMVRPLED